MMINNPFALTLGTVDATIVNTPTVQQVPGTSGGLSTNIQQALTGSAQIKGSVIPAES